LTLLYFQLSLTFETIGIFFGIRSRKTVRQYIDRWAPKLGEVGKILSDFQGLIDEEVLSNLEPEWYRKMGLSKIAAVVDGKDFLSETCRKDGFLNCAQVSNKVNHSAFRVITWSLPCGAVIGKTPLVFGRFSGKAIMRAWGRHGRLLFPEGYYILGDKGFAGTTDCYTNFNATLHPAFLCNGQFNLAEVLHNIEITKKRYSCEIVYSRVTGVKKLGCIIKRECFHHMQDICDWAHGHANINYGYLQKIDNYEH
jgi:hypothetical protein